MLSQGFLRSLCHFVHDGNSGLVSWTKLNAFDEVEGRGILAESPSLVMLCNILVILDLLCRSNFIFSQSHKKLEERRRKISPPLYSCWYRLCLWNRRAFSLYYIRATLLNRALSAMSVTSDELNYLIWRYLQESGKFVTQAVRGCINL